jgi:type II secretory pathway pseudopilin PulG
MTLIELLVAASLGLIVVGGAMSVFISGVRSEPRTASKVEAIQQARVAMDRVTRELRQGLEVSNPPLPSASELAIVTYVKAATCGGAAASTSIPCRVTYSCDGAVCTRTVAQPDGSGASSPVQVVDGLTSPSVFSYEPSAPADPGYVGIAFSLSTDGGRPVVIEDGVALRNPGEGV